MVSHVGNVRALHMVLCVCCGVVAVGFARVCVCVCVCVLMCVRACVAFSLLIMRRLRRWGCCSHVDLTPLLRLEENKGYVAILIFTRFGDPKKAWDI